MTEQATGAGQVPAEPSPGGRVPAHTVVAERYTIGGFVRRTPTAEIYRASDLHSDREVDAHVIHRELVATADMRDAVMGAARAAMPLAHPNIVRTLDTVFDGHYCVVVTEPVQGNSLHDLLQRRAAAGGAGLGPRGVINLMDAICDALRIAGDVGVCHGSLSAHQVFVIDDGTVQVSGFGLGALEAAAAQEGLLDRPHDMSPETAATGEPSPHGDVYSLGMLMYELLIGQPLVKGGPRPSAAVPGLSGEMDRLMAVSVSPGPDQRPRLAEFQAGLRHAFAAPARDSSVDIQMVEMAHALSITAAHATIDPALLADDVEKWLISKGRLDYGPYSLADVVEQIRTDQILPGHVIMDNHTGERCNVEDHPILGVLVDRAKQARDDARRANAEVVHAKQQKRRGATLYLVIAAGVSALAVIAYFVVVGASRDEGKQVAGLATVGESEFNAKITFPKKEAKKSSGKRSGRSSGGGGGGGNDDVLALDMGSEGGGTERLDDSVINETIQRYGGKLGGCLARNGGGYAKIAFSVAGATGKVNSVQVNGQTSGGLYTCINRVMRSMKFPTFDGPRTRAEFDMEI